MSADVMTDNAKSRVIPRIVHYCWFGRGRKSPAVESCIASWRKHLPDYEIVEWNEDNFDVDSFPYAAEAYQARKFAFVSDVARGEALYREGGIYLDTDVEVLKTFDPLLHYRSFWGFEAGNFVATSTIGAVKGHEWIREYLDHYRDRKFVGHDGAFDLTPNVIAATELLQKHGLLLDNTRQVIGGGNVVCPQSYFSPYDYRIGVTSCDRETITIHHYSNTWNTTRSFRVKRFIKSMLGAKIGGKLCSKVWLRARREP